MTDDPHTLSILVIDDDATMRSSLSGILVNDMGIPNTLTAENGLAGWRLLQKNPCDLVLLDWMMPVMDGYNFVKTVRQNPRHYGTKIIMVTSKKDMKDVTDALNAGVTSYLIKPFDKETLIKKIRLVLGAPRLSPKESEFLESAERHLAAQDYDAALADFSKALDVVPGNLETKLKHVETLMKKLDYGKAYVLLSEVLKGDMPPHLVCMLSTAMVRLGDVDFKGGRLDESEAKYHEAVAADPRQAEGYVGLGEVELKRGNREKADQHFAAAGAMALDVGDEDMTLINNIAIRHRRSGRAKLAVRVLEEALQGLDKGNPYLLYNLGRAYMDLDQMEQAAICFRDALALDPGIAEARQMLEIIKLNT